MKNLFVFALFCFIFASPLAHAARGSEIPDYPGDEEPCAHFQCDDNPNVDDDSREEEPIVDEDEGRGGLDSELW